MQPALRGADGLRTEVRASPRHVLKAVGLHRAQAAKILGMDRKTLYRKLEHWESDLDDTD